MVKVDKTRKELLAELIEKLSLTCSDYSLLNTALTHSSYTFENKLSSLLCNERLEFLGDAVLKLVASEYLHERFPTYPEGELTKIRAILISDSILAKIADEKINLSKYLRIGYHEAKMGGRTRPSTLACAFEALLGALYLDGKMNELQSMLINLLEDEVTEIEQCAAKYNYKAILQEYTQAEGIELPLYKIVEESGPPHDKTFKIEVLINNEVCGFGTGKSKKEAQQKAAELAVKSLNLLE